MMNKAFIMLIWKIFVEMSYKLCARLTSDEFQIIQSMTIYTEYVYTHIYRKSKYFLFTKSRKYFSISNRCLQNIIVDIKHMRFRV